MPLLLLKPGAKAREKHTGFAGVVTALQIETGDRVTYRLEGPSTGGARGNVKWFEADRIECDEPAKTASQAKAQGSESVAGEHMQEIAVLKLAKVLSEALCPCLRCDLKRARRHTH